jgi:3-phosphoshikimate 1-carboxyvinyltransferase
MKLVAGKSRLRGTVPIPASKSHTIRAVAIAALAEGKSVIRNPLISGDTLSAVACYRALGAGIDTSDDRAWKVEGTGGRPRAPSGTIDVGNSGTTLRIAVSSAALCAGAGEIRLTGDEQIQRRPIGPLLRSLGQLGARAESEKGNDMAPIRVRGVLRGGKTEIECKTSQYLTSLLLAAPLAEGDTEIDVTLLNEPDYVRMTLDWLDRQGIRYEREELRRFKIHGGQRYRGFDLAVPADFSSATFFLCAGALLDADISLTGLDFSDSQPDKAVADYLGRMGADLKVEPDAVRVRTSQLEGIDIDMNKTPDALPAMAVTGAFAAGETRLLNVPQARIKETDRIACMAEELGKLGARVQELPDGLVVRHSPGLRPAELDGRADHRIVMALSLALMALEGEGAIDTAEAVRVTFPEYVDLMKRIGARIELKQ